MIKNLINMIVYVLEDSANYVLSYDRDLDTSCNSPWDIVQVDNEYGLINDYDMFLITKAFHKKLPVQFLKDN